MAHQAGAYPSFCSIKRLGILLLPPFFGLFIIEQNRVSDSRNIALKKVHGQSGNASQLRANTYRLVNLICKDQAKPYFFQRQIPGTPPYWKKFMREVIAMVKQLGIPALS